MAWNDPFETLVETAVDELGTFLMNRGDLAAYEVARTQEVCRDFCKFLCKDVHKATSQDYAVYLQMHAMTPEDEADYGHMLADIRSYCEQSGHAAQYTQGASMAMRRKVTTNEIENSAEHAVDMFSMENNGPVNTNAGASQAFNMRRNSMAFDMRRNSIALELNNSPESLEMQALLGAATPPKPVDAIKATEADSFSNRFNKFDFSVDEALAEDLNNVTKFPAAQPQKQNQASTPAKPQENIQNDYDYGYSNHANLQNELDYAYANEPNEQSENSRYQLNVASESIAIPLNANDIAPKPDTTATEQANELLRGVSGVEYNFSHNSIRKMRDFEKQQRKTENITSNAIDYKLVGRFRSFVFERKFVIDTPLPELEKFAPYKTSFVWRYFIPLVPTLVLLAFAGLLFTIHHIPGLIFVGLALVMLVFEIPNIKPADQSTPQTTLLAYLNSRPGRCYGSAMSLIAQPKENQEEILFHTLWEPELQWHKAYIARFKSQPIPDCRVPLGSESQNALILIYNNDAEYWLVPMVRLGTKWYITDPTLGHHTIVKES